MDILMEYLNSIDGEYQVSTSNGEIYESDNYRKVKSSELMDNDLYFCDEKYYEKNTKMFAVNNIKYIIIVYNDVTKYINEIISSKIDCLTRLPNRAQIEKHLNEIIEECVIVMIDIDNFKKVNDEYGHQIGDSVIKLIGDFIRNSVGKNNFAGRYGGEEFLVIFNETDEFLVKDQMDYFNKLLNKYTQPVNVSASIGIYKYDPKLEKVENAVRKADEALYWVKHNGKNNSIIYSEMKKLHQL